MTDTGIDRDDLPQAFAQPNGVAEAITRLVVTEGAGCTNSVTSPDHVICREIAFMHPTGAAHSLQNFAPTGFSLPQFEQIDTSRV